MTTLPATRKIKSTCPKKRGALRGVRLINYDSLSNYIHAQAEGAQ